MSYSFRKIDVNTDIDVMTQLISQNLNTGDVLAAKSVNWNYTLNPIKNAEGLALLDEASEQQVVGIINQSYRQFLINNKRTQVCLFGDLVVDSKHRSLMPAIMLLRAAISKGLDNAALVYSFPNKKSVNVALRAGFESLGKITRYVHIVSYRDYIGRVIPWKLVGKPLSWLLDTINKLKHVLVQRTAYRHYIATTQKLSTTELQTLMSGSDFSRFLMAYRSAESIEWRYAMNPFAEFDYLKCLHQQSNHVVAYAVLERSEKLLHIRDIYALNNESLSAMLSFCISRARQLGIPAVSVGYLGNIDIKKQIVKSGFSARETDRSVVIKFPDGTDANYYLNTDNWYLVDGDEDH